ncbi:MAG: DUF2147 domain-containing protein [Bacteroidota bacterium]
MNKSIIVLVGILYSVALFSQSKADQILGQFWTDNKEGKIEIFKKGDTYHGKILWRKVARKDTENPNKSLRDRSVVGIVFMKNFVFNDSKWVDGEVYSIDNGRTYSGKMWLEDGGNTLKMRGFIGISLLGRTASLKRIKK